MTAEFAVLMPGFVLLLAVLLAAGTVAVAQLRCVDAARAAARLAARHESGAAVLAAAHSVGPAGASVQVQSDADLVQVSVEAVIALPLPGRPSIGVGSTSVAQLEPTAALGPLPRLPRGAVR